MLAAGKIEMRACREKNVHAKVYITRYGEYSPFFGSVITGSSNFTENGLNAQHEFNVELKDTPDVKFALEKFEEMWKDGIDITEEYINAIDNKTWLNDSITPYQMYLKCLYEYFYGRINLEEIKPDLPKGYLELKYQTDAIAEISKIVEEYGGAFLSDVVGLGKTYIAAMYAQTLKGKILVITPPAIKPNWESAFKDFGLKTRDYDIISKGLIEKEADRIEKEELSGKKSYEYVFVDEAHSFRNGKTKSFENLRRICLNKKIILISATPLNNTFFDFYYLLSLFQNPIHSDIPGMENYLDFFVRKRQELKKIEAESGSKDTPEYISKIKKISKEVRDKILQYVMIRRTRTDIKKYFYDDILSQGLHFPEVNDPIEIVYRFDRHTNEVFDRTIRIIGGGKNVPKEEKLSYAGYAPKTYLKDIQISAFEATQQKNNAGFMKSRLVKRLESSKYAFEKTLERSIESHEKFIKMFNSGTVYISNDFDVLDCIGDDDTVNIEDLLEQEKNWEAISSADFNDEFLPSLERDLSLLKYLLFSWRNIRHDYKQEKFIKELAENSLIKGKKIVVFTESAETGQNLADALRKIYSSKVMFYSSAQSQNVSMRETIRDNYDPNCDRILQKDDIQLLITTDVLSEGINLHRSNIIVNYDLPWNPTRVMQRAGRVNRIGSEHDRIYIFNFFPTSETDKELGLRESIIAKIQAFHNALGEDSKYLSEDEEPESFNISGQRLYEALSKTGSFDDGEENPQLKYLKLIREIRDSNIGLYVQIANMPRKIRTARAGAGIDGVSSHGNLITFFKKGEKLCEFCITNGNETRKLSFIEAIKFFECAENEPKKTIPDEYYEYIAKNKEIFGEPIDTEPVRANRGRSNASKAIKMLKGIIRSPEYNNEEKTYIQSIITALAENIIPEYVSKELCDYFKKADSSFAKVLMRIREIVPEPYLASSGQWKNSQQAKREVVLSEYIHTTNPKG